jgi:hypothetical protein
MPNPKTNAGYRGHAIAVAVAASALLSGCAMANDGLSSVVVAPGNYVLFTCDDIARTTKGVEARRKELEQLTAKAGTDTAGRIIAETTYGTEYVSTQGQLNSLRAAAAEKNCDSAPDAAKPTTPASKTR